MQATSALAALCPVSCSAIHLVGCQLTQVGQKKLSSRGSDWGRACVRLSISACKIILQGYLWLTCPMVAKRVYFWFGRRPLNCLLIMQRKCYSRLVNFFWHLIQRKISGYDQLKITQPELRFCFDLPLIICLPLKMNSLVFRVWLQNDGTDTMNETWTTHCIDSTK